MSDVQRKEPAKPPVLIRETQSIIHQLEEKLDGPLLSYWNSSNGSICGNDSLAIYELLKDRGFHENMYLFIRSDGGSGISALKMINIIRQFCRRLTALVPFNCASAATMLALGCDSIEMGPLSYLTAVDTSLTHDLSPIDKDNDRVRVSMDELNRVIKLWNSSSTSTTENPYKNLYQYVHPLVFGAVDRASSLSLRLCKELLAYHMTDDAKIEEISGILNSDYPAHEYPIVFKQAQKLGLHVDELSRDKSDLLHELHLVYAKMGQRALTDYDERSYHNNSINNILEVDGKQIYYQIDKDFFYRPEERRYIPMNDGSSWRKNEVIGDELVNSVYHLW